MYEQRKTPEKPKYSANESGVSMDEGFASREFTSDDPLNQTTPTVSRKPLQSKLRGRMPTVYNPSVFGKPLQNPGPRQDFWSIDQRSTICPVEINGTTYYHSPTNNERSQALDAFWTSNQFILPSPMVIANMDCEMPESLQHRQDACVTSKINKAPNKPSINPRNRKKKLARRSKVAAKVTTVDQACQTTVSIPSNIDIDNPELTNVLNSSPMQIAPKKANTNVATPRCYFHQYTYEYESDTSMDAFDDSLIESFGRLGDYGHGVTDVPDIDFLGLSPIQSMVSVMSIDDVDFADVPNPTDDDFMFGDDEMN